MRRPLCGIALAYSAGTLAGLTDVFPWWLLIVTACLCLVAGLIFYTSRFSTLVILFLIFLISALQANIHTRSPSGRDLRKLVRRSSEQVRLTGVVDTDTLFMMGPGQGKKTGEFLLQVDGLERVGVWQRADGKVQVRWTGLPGDREPKYGEKWAFRGLLKISPEGLFKTRPPFLVVDAAQAEWVSSGHGLFLSEWCYRARLACYRILGLGLEDFPDQAGLLRALILGYREELQAAWKKDFSATGTIHIFAISGTHVGVMWVLFALVLRALGVSRQHWSYVLIPLLVLYTLATGMASSAVRACIMAAVFMSADALERKADGWSSLAMAALIILVFDPFQLVDLGFILSFAAVAGLMALYSSFHQPMARLLAHDPWEQDEPARKTDWRKSVKPILTFLAGSLAAWFATAPLT
ncbi:MAG: ComEC/Rec2 family competence protein, partial [Lentisphaerota bacterium]